MFPDVQGDRGAHGPTGGAPPVSRRWFMYGWEYISSGQSTRYSSGCCRDLQDEEGSESPSSERVVPGVRPFQSMAIRTYALTLTCL